MMRKTKIIGTLGPATDDPNVLIELIRNGLDVARVNFSHGTYEEHLKRIQAVKEIREKVGRPVALLMDTKGPEIRIGTFENHTVYLQEGQEFILTSDDTVGNEHQCSVSYPELYKELKPHDRVLINDGLVEVRVTRIEKAMIHTVVVNGGEISDRKSLTVPGLRLSLPALTQKDIKDIKFAIENDFDIIAASFIQRADDVIHIKQILEQNHCSDMLVIAKIENSEGVKNFEQILEVADGIMIARGDLGVEMPVESVPIIQKQITKQCYLSGKPAIVATQMLESMIQNPRPTRAESSDIANAIYDGASTIMLSGETAVGKYPIETLQTMARIALETERNINYWKRFETTNLEMSPNITNAISHAACTTAMDLKATAILTVTKTGNTARLISRFRPACPIIATTTSEKVLRQLMISWGILPFLVQEASTTDDMFEFSTAKAVESGLVNNGDLTVITAGAPVGISGTTNLLKVHMVGKVIMQGKTIGEGMITGSICLAHTPEDIEMCFGCGHILVAKSTNNTYIHFIRQAKAVIVEDPDPASHAVISCTALNIPIVYGAKGVMNAMKHGDTITIDMSKGQIYDRNNG